MKSQLGFKKTAARWLLMLWALDAVGLLQAPAQSTNAPPAAGPIRSDERARLREELQRLAPEERRERIRALRQQRAAPAGEQPSAEARRRALLQRKIEELRRKQADGSITPPERALLERLQRAVASREAARATNSPSQTRTGVVAETNAPPAAAPAPSP